MKIKLYKFKKVLGLEKKKNKPLIIDGKIRREDVHADIFEGGADCRSRSPMRLMNKGISKAALENHGLFEEQILTIELTKPRSFILEIAPADEDS